VVLAGSDTGESQDSALTFYDQQSNDGVSRKNAPFGDSQKNKRLHFTPSSKTRGVATGWTGVYMSTPLLPETIPEIDANPASFLLFWGSGGWGSEVANVHVQQQQPGCKCFLLQCSPVHLLAVHQ